MKKIIKPISLIIAVGYLIPLYFVVVNGFKSKQQLMENPLAIGFDPSVSPFYYHIGGAEQINFLHVTFNSIFVTVVSVALILFVSSLCAWTLARNPGKKSNIIMAMMIASMLLPFQVIMVPLVNVTSFIDGLTPSFLNLTDSLIGMCIVYIGLGVPLATVIMHSFIKSIPYELEESAMIDGYSKFQVYTKVVIPLIKPSLLTVAIMDVLWIWNDYLFPSLMVKSLGNMTIPLASYAFFGQFNIQWNYAMAILTITIIPVIIFFFLAQKHMIKGITAGAIK